MDYTFNRRRRSSSMGSESAVNVMEGGTHRAATSILQIQLERSTRAGSLEVGVEAIAARAAAQAELLEQGQRVATLLGLLRRRPGLGRGPQRTGIGHGGLAPCRALLAAAVGRLCDLLVGHEGWELAEVLQHRVVEGTGRLPAVGLQLILRGFDSLGWSYKQRRVTGLTRGAACACAQGSSISRSTGQFSPSIHTVIRGYETTAHFKPSLEETIKEHACPQEQHMSTWSGWLAYCEPEHACICSNVLFTLCSQIWSSGTRVHLLQPLSFLVTFAVKDFSFFQEALAM